MLIACWSAKGGSGTTVVAASLAALLSRHQPTLLVDLDGDVPPAVGMPDDDRAGVGDWLAAGDHVAPDALGRLEVAVGPRLSLLPVGTAIADAGAGRADVLLALLAADERPVVVDCGAEPAGVCLAVAAGASHSLLVLRPCYLALRRALRAPLRPSGLVLVDEPGRALGRRDVEEVLGVPVRATVPLDPSVARAVDAGLLATRVPFGLRRALRSAPGLAA
jgi:cellulose biosynthesis protein BcsQ